VRENSGKGSRYNRCNVYQTTILTKTLPTGWWDNWRDSKPFQYKSLVDQCWMFITFISISVNERFPCIQHSAQKNFYAAIISRLERSSNARRIWQNPSTARQRSLLILKSSNATLFKHFVRRNVDNSLSRKEFRVVHWNCWFQTIFAIISYYLPRRSCR